MTNPFAPRLTAEQRNTIQQSKYHCPEYAWMLTLLHAYKGLGRQRVALQEAIVPPQRPGGPPYATVDYDEYEVKWEGYASSENTWEPVAHLEGCMSFVKAYEKGAASGSKKK